MLRLIIVYIILFHNALAWSADTDFPIKLSHEFIRHTLIKQLFRWPGETFKAIDDGSGCYFLRLSYPKIDMVLPYLRVTSNVSANVGKAIGKHCVSIAKWDGKIEIFEAFEVPESGQKVTAKVVKSNLLDKSGNEAKVSNKIWQWVNKYVHPRMERVVFDLEQPVKEIKILLPIAFPHVEESAMSAIIHSLRMKNVVPEPDGLEFTFLLTIPKKYTVVSKPAPPLSDAEKVKIQGLLDRLDSFYTNVIRFVGYKNIDQDILEELFNILIELRHEVVFILTEEKSFNKDPVPELFLSTWIQLRPIMLKLSATHSRFQHTMQFIGFIAANEALAALNRKGPALGLDISTRGLRRLARLAMPSTKEPLKYNQGVDSVLRSIFGFGPPIKSHKPPTLNHFFDWFISSALAQNDLDPVLIQSLNQFIPNRSNVKDYLPMARKALHFHAENQLGKQKLNQKYHNTYRWLIFATAWKESCWRQYVQKKGQKRPLLSNAGAVGMMQVVPKIWRGFYDPYLLKWDLFYNIEAGSEILFRYMTRYALRKKEHLHTGGLDNLARAAYAIYNAGPRKRSRYRNPNATSRQKRVDRAFYQKYIKVKKGKELQVKLCFG